MASGDVRVRVAERVVRVRVNETRVRAVVRVAAPEEELWRRYACFAVQS